MQSLKYINLWALSFLILIQPAKGMEDEDLNGGQIPHPHPQLQIDENTLNIQLGAKLTSKNISAEAQDIDNGGLIKGHEQTYVKAEKNVVNQASGVIDGDSTTYVEGKERVENAGHLLIDANGKLDAPMLNVFAGGDAILPGKKGVNLDGRASVYHSKEWNKVTPIVQTGNELDSSKLNAYLYSTCNLKKM